MILQILILQFATGRIIVVPINVQSDLETTKTTEQPTESPTEQTEKLDHWDIYEAMIRISINNPLNWYSF
jgi:hypothetical protein